MNQRRIWALVAVAGVLMATPGLVRASGLSIGAKAGLSVPDIRGSETDVYTRGFTSRQGPFFGLVLEARLGSGFSLVTELNYVSQGGKRNGLQPITMDMSELPVPPGTLLFGNFQNETILNYIELPVLARFVFGRQVRFFLSTGPYAGLLVGHHAVTKGTGPIYLDEGGTMPIIIPPATDPLIVDFSADTDVGSSLRHWNAGIQGCLGVLYPIGPGDVTVELRFELGLMTIQRDVTTSGSSQTGAVIVAVGYSLPLHRR